ncbi:UDP-glucose dehydrogenase family protein [Halofilum ochraceum]|uniref:UDP-glucose dehydrogenase family protein n=1 Tax=Halofilum ochraceum TaxID=1611323 RepID=UPI000831CB2E|nr:UDP-glucose/GDP-mannose dehydrogenase family protein [Halofilum ochraceum]
MNVTVFGSGYVGLVTGACLADAGNKVLCVDIDPDRVERLKRGELPIYEPGLADLITGARELGHIDFTTDAARAVAHAEVQFIAVGTPSDEDGSADLKHVLAVARTIGEQMTAPKIVVTKSTVPVGTGDKVEAALREALDKRDADHRFDVVSNPEFLKEGAAVADFMKPDRIIVGGEDHDAIERLRELYVPFSRSHEKLIVMDRRSAELTKYAANAMLATKISFMNEMANLAERLGADIEHIRNGIGSDPRIGYSFIYPGCGYGGSCFPKDVKALEWTAREHGYQARLVQAVEAVNDDQKRTLVDKVQRHYDGNLKGRTFAIWGLAFKPNTDDMREAPSRVLMEALWKAGANVRAFDPEAMDECRRIYGERDDLTLCTTPEETLNGSDALVVVTEWKVFRSPDFELIHKKVADRVIFDGRNIYSPEFARRHGLMYYGIGRGRTSLETTSHRGA